MSGMQQGMGSLSTILKRLEAATSRLEDLALSHVPGGPSAAPPASATVPAMPAIGAGAVSTTRDGPSSAKASSAVVQEFVALQENALKRYVTLSEQLGGLVAEQAHSVQQAFNAQAEFVEMASSCKQVPTTSPAFPGLLKSTQEPLSRVLDIKEKNRGSKEINFLNTVAEGIPALGWVTLDSKPGPFVGEMKDAAQFYANRVVKDNKGTNDTAIQWTKAFTGLLEDLRKYIMAHHTTGLSWNPSGMDAAQYTPKNGSSAPAATTTGAPAPPPPPPPAPAPMDVDAPKERASAAPSAAGMTSVFASLNQGEAITSGLRKVKPSEMTHKNPELRAAAAAPTASSTTPAKAPKPASLSKQATAAPPKKVLEGNKWTVENFDGDSNISIDETELNQIVNVYNVKNSTIVIKGKVNAVSLVNCRKTSVLLDSLVSSLAISTSPSFTVQILGAVPTLQIDGTDGGQVYLSKASLGIEIITAKSSALNISLPVAGEEEGVFEEKPVPEQIKTVVQNGKLVSSIVEHSA